MHAIDHDHPIETECQECDDTSGNCSVPDDTCQGCGGSIGAVGDGMICALSLDALCHTCGRDACDTEL